MITIYRVNIISLLSFTHLLGRFVVGNELLQFLLLSIWLNMLQYDVLNILTWKIYTNLGITCSNKVYAALFDAWDLAAILWTTMSLYGLRLDKLISGHRRSTLYKWYAESITSNTHHHHRRLKIPCFRVILKAERYRALLIDGNQWYIKC